MGRETSEHFLERSNGKLAGKSLDLCKRAPFVWMQTRSFFVLYKLWIDCLLQFHSICGKM